MAILKRLVDLIRREPVMTVALVVAVLELGAAFGFSLQDKQSAAIKAVAEIIVGIIVRAQVSPTVNPPPPAKPA